MFVSGNQFNVVPNGWDTGYSAAVFNSQPDSEYSNYVKTSNDGSVIFFADNANAAKGETYNLYYRETEQKLEDGATGQDDAHRVAKDVNGEFEVSNNGKYVAYLKNVENGKGKLYISDLKLETVIEERDVVSFQFSDDNNYILYNKNSGEQYDTVYIKRLGDNSEKQLIDNNVVKIVSCTPDFERIYYLLLGGHAPHGARRAGTGVLLAIHRHRHDGHLRLLFHSTVMILPALSSGYFSRRLISALVS